MPLEPIPLRPMANFATTFSQVQVTLDGKPQNRSDWGSVSVTYPPSEQVAYFNLAIGERWVVQNAPLVPPAGGQAPALLFYFNLAVSPGVVVNTLQAATSVADTPSTDPPSAYATVLVHQRTEIYWTNFGDTPYTPLGPPPDVYKGGALGPGFFCRLNYPNQPCGKNECGPTAVSNGVKWLNDEYKLNIPPEKLTIDFWKTVLGWTADNGVPHGAWADLKQKFVDDKANGLPINSRKESGGHAKEALAEFQGKKADGKKPASPAQAIEIDIGSHIASVTCMSGPDSSENYHLNAASDIAQNGQAGPGDPQIQEITINANGDVLSGPPWAAGKKVNNFVIQCPAPGKFTK